MVRTYYVTHPNIEVSALVHAPSTEKARTLFLDFLEREGGISRAHRSRLREHTVAERMRDPAGVVADVELHHTEPVGEAPSFALGEVEEPEELLTEEGFGPLMPVEAMPTQGMPIQVAARSSPSPRAAPEGAMPIQLVARAPMEGLRIQAVARAPTALPIQTVARAAHAMKANLEAPIQQVSRAPVVFPIQEVASGRC